MKIKHIKTNPFIIFLLGFFIVFSVPVFAERIFDNAGLLSAQEKENLEDMTNSIAAAYNFDLVIVTERDIGVVNPYDYADNFFNNNIGISRNGGIFLHLTGSREYLFSTSGRGTGILNNTASGKLEADVIKFLREGQNYQAYRAFLLAWEEFLKLEARGRNFNFFHRWNAVLVAISWLIAFVIGIFVVQSWKKELNTVHPQTSAAGYMIPGSASFSAKTDSFLYSTVTKTKRQTQNTSSGGTRSGSFSGRQGSRGGRY